MIKNKNFAKIIDSKEKPMIDLKVTKLKEMIHMGSVIVKERESKGLSQTKLSQMAKVPKSTLSDLENGRHQPNFKTLAKVVKALSNS